MTSIALNGASINQSIATSHISTERYIQTGTECTSWDDDGYCTNREPVYNWVGGYSTNATINGTIKAKQSNVFIQGKNPALLGDNTIESDSYNLSSNERYASGQHSSATGKISSGNSKNVYIGGVLIATNDSTIQTHASTNTTIKDGFSSNVHIGG
ncbi:hypothetical protein ABNX05_11650 [Lysinibacillus sp. M3]|uniref:Uncharacterized protein n=1 Tax=Lysinibacillus zambalensis TaxID=3160866 RepID=A0ABV1MUJ1_9BACI